MYLRWKFGLKNILNDIQHTQPKNEMHHSFPYLFISHPNFVHFRQKVPPSPTTSRKRTNFKTDLNVKEHILGILNFHLLLSHVKHMTSIDFPCVTFPYICNLWPSFPNTTFTFTLLCKTKQKKKFSFCVYVYLKKQNT